jgi:plastocyanin
MTVARSIALGAVLGLTISAAPATTTISIVANNGAQSFTPDPATAVSGDSLVWRNNDFTTHRIVLDSGALDTGDIIPGASSAPMTLTGAGGSYHCAIHPSMVGTIGSGCTFSLAPSSASVAAAASSGGVSVTAAAGCAWTAMSNSGFLTVTSGASGSGNGTVTYGVAANPTTSSRSGSITIAGQTFTITQAAAASTCPTIVLAPATLANVTLGVPASLTLTASGGTPPYVFAVTAGSLPAGLTLSSSGVLSGTPAAAGSSTFTARASDAGGCFAESGYTLTVVAAVPTMPQALLIVLAAGLIGLGWFRLARGGAPERCRLHGGIRDDLDDRLEARRLLAALRVEIPGRPAPGVVLHRDARRKRHRLFFVLADIE